MTHPQYELLKQSITDDDARAVFEYLQHHIGYAARASIEDISQAVFRSRSDNAVRKTRDVIETLRTDYHVPVCSSSGRAGRWLAATQAELNECLADYQSRAESTRKVIDALRVAKVPPPVTMEIKPVQPGLFG